MLWILFSVLLAFASYDCAAGISDDLPTGVDCANGTTWKDECNTCSCMGGRGACTLMGCDENSGPSRECAPNSAWRNGCNICVCTSEGKRICTLMDCTKHNEVPGKLPSGVDCAPGTSWKNDCNTCSCMGDHAGCTLMGCLGPRHGPRRDCAPNTSWKKGCNVCVCTKDGKRVCTDEKCA